MATSACYANLRDLREAYERECLKWPEVQRRNEALMRILAEQREVFTQAPFFVKKGPTP